MSAQPIPRQPADGFADQAQKEKPLGERFVDAGLLTESQLDLALREQRRVGGLLGEVLVQLGFVTAEQFTEVLARENQIEIFDVLNADIEADVLSLVGYETARKHKVLPVRLHGDELTVAFADAFDVFAMDQVERECGKFVNVVTAPAEHIVEAIERCYTRRSSINETIETVLSGDSSKVRDGDDETPMVRLVDQILGDAIKHDASDVHFQAEEKNLRVRLRIDGVLHDEITVPKQVQPALINRIKLISGMNITEKRIPQDGRIRFKFGSSRVDLRVSTLPTNHGESVVMRILDSNSARLSLDQLGLLEHDQLRFDDAINRAHGMTLVTGPTGSGKTTTLYAALSKIDKNTRSVFTLEDPVEYNLPSIRQTQINDDVGMDFATGLRALLRQDPDVILVGEIRDQETAELAVRAALTGHTVFSTLHTNSAIGAVTRLIDMGIARYLIPSSLMCVVGQRLVRRLCPECRELQDGVNELFTDPRFTALRPDDDAHWEAPGCEHCNNTGFRGRLAVYEVLTLDETFRDAVLNSEPDSRLLKIARQSGMKTLFEDGLTKANRGDTAISEVFRVLR